MVRRATRLLGLAALLVAVQALVGLGGALAGPIGLVCTNGPTFNLVARVGLIETPDGNAIYSWGFANGAGGLMQAPGPIMCVTQGQTVTVNLQNTLSEPVSIVFPGQEGVSAAGSPGLLTAEAPPGGSASYTFVAGQPGTYLYESGSRPDRQVEMGLFGAIVVRPAGHPTWAYDDPSTAFDPAREYILILGEIDPELHRAVETGGTYDVNALHNRYFSINGREFPDTIQDNGVSWLEHQPYGALVRVKPYNGTTNPLPALIRMVNAGELNHPYHPHGNHLRLIAQDGRQIKTPGGLDATTEHFAETIPSGATFDLLFSWTDQDSFSSTNPLPLTIPSYRNLGFKDGNTWYSGSPYLGTKGTLPAGVTSQNVCGELYFPWHSHALNEFTNFDEGFGGMATLLRVDPSPGCTSSPTSATILAGTLRSGSYSALATVDASLYAVNSTTVAPFRTDWYAGFSGVLAGAQNLRVQYTGRNSVPANQTLFVWQWTTSTWIPLGPAALVGTTDVSFDLPATAAGVIGTGSNAGKVRVRVFNQRASGTGSFFTSGNAVKLVYDAP